MNKRSRKRTDEIWPLTLYAIAALVGGLVLLFFDRQTEVAAGLILMVSYGFLSYLSVRGSNALIGSLMVETLQDVLTIDGVANPTEEAVMRTETEKTMTRTLMVKEDTVPNMEPGNRTGNSVNNPNQD